MIVPMKKVSFVIREKDREAFLKKLRDVGVVHPERKRVAVDNMGHLLAMLTRNRMALGILKRFIIKEGTEVPPLPEIPADRDMASHILELVNERKILQDQTVDITRERRRVEAWGNFDPRDLSFLAEHGIILIPYELSLGACRALDADYIVVSSDKYRARIVVLGEEIAGQDPFEFSAQSISEMDDRLNVIRLRFAEIESALECFAFYTGKIEEDMNSINLEIEFQTTRAGMDGLKDAPAEIAISWITGYVPCENIEELEKAAASNNWVMLTNEPTLQDLPPTILRNKPAVRIIQPMFNMMGTIPGYWEDDVSLPFMIFLCVFFAMIFGDAVYGLLLLGIGAAAGLAAKKKSGEFPDVAKLIMLFSSCTIVWGAVTGSWLAVPIPDLPPFLRVLVLPPFNGVGPVTEFPSFLGKLLVIPEETPFDDGKNIWYVQFVCFTLGVIQLGSARVKNFIKSLPSLSAISQAGSFVMMIGVYFLVLSILLKMELPSFAAWFVGAGVILNLVFSEQKGGNFFVNIGKGFSNFFSIFLKAVGGFSDIISFIRLFAVGMAGSLIGQIFNSMAIPSGGFGNFGIGFIVRLLGAILILFAGHGLNILMNTLSLIVHGVRLNLLEYAGNHLGMDWSGYLYKPFAVRQKK